MKTDELLQVIERDEALGEARRLLMDHQSRQEPLPEHWHQALRCLKDAAKEKQEELTAKAIWCLETIARAQDHFIQAYIDVRADAFIEAWRQLERCEVELALLRNHYRSDPEPFGLKHMDRYVPKLQDLFPYVLFASPGYVVKEARCSICNTAISLRSNCGHRLGQIYAGEICGRLITKAEILEVSMVTNPVQKYSVIVPKRVNYAPVHTIVRRLVSPWSHWECRRSEIISDLDMYQGTGRNELCPCGSRRKYKRCCLGQKRVKEHFEVLLEDEPLEELPKFEDNVEYWIERKEVGVTE